MFKMPIEELSGVARIEKILNASRDCNNLYQHPIME